MAYIDFKKLRSRVPLSAILDHYGFLEALEETIHGYEGYCPFCGGEGKTFKANTEKNAWFCFGECRTAEEKNGGNIFDFVMRKEQVKLPKAAAMIQSWFPKKEVQKGEQKEVAEQEDTAITSREGVGESEKEGDTKALDNPEKSITEDSVEPIFEGKRNNPLGFELRSISYDHAALEEFELSPEILKHFGVGYFTGKGQMHNRIVIPIHNNEGQLVAYVGYSPDSRTYKYPANFDPRLEVYNYYRVMFSVLGDPARPMVVVTDYFDLFRLYEAGVKALVCIPTPELHEPQIKSLKDILPAGGMIDLVVTPDSGEYLDILSSLLPVFHVQLLKSRDERNKTFLKNVAAWLTR